MKETWVRKGITVQMNKTEKEEEQEKEQEEQNNHQE